MERLLRFFGLNEIDNKTEADHREAVFAKEKRSKLIPGGGAVRNGSRERFGSCLRDASSSNTFVAIWSFVYMTTACWPSCNFKDLRTGSIVKSFDDTTVLLAEHPARQNSEVMARFAHAHSIFSQIAMHE